MPATLKAPPFMVTGDWAVGLYTITASQTFEVGEPVYLDSSGTLAVAAADDNDVGNIKILGLSLGDATQLLLEGLKCPVLIPSPTSQWLLPLYHSTKASAILALANLDLANTYPLRNQGGIWCVNVENNGTNDRMMVVGFHEEYAPSETYGWVWTKFLHGSTFAEAT